MLNSNVADTVVELEYSKPVEAKPVNCKTADDIRNYLNERAITHVKVGFTDIDGVLRGKHIAKAKFLSALEKGIAFCDVVVGWDCNDQLYDGVRTTGWHTGYPDARIRIIPESMRLIPLENDMPFFLCEFVGSAGEICPRRVLQRVLDRIEGLGFLAYAGIEYEFFLFNETPESVRAKGYRNLETLTPGYFGYSVLRSSVHAELYTELLDLCEKMEMPLEGLHTETGPGVIEAAIGFDGALRTADNASVFKTFTKVFAQRRKLMASFMAKWSEQWPGQSGHLHLSLRSRNGNCVFHNEHAESTMSASMRYFIGGMQRLLPELTCMAAPTINDYSRLVPGYWAPTSASWAVENRTVALRAILGDRTSQRIEYRISSADANPYLAMSAALASGVWGIENKIEPTPPAVGNDYARRVARSLAIPATLSEAVLRFRNSPVAEELFGKDFVDHFAATREWEAREFQKQVTDWELRRYFEII